MIDHEFRIITPEVKRLLRNRIKSESVLLQKIPLNFVSNKGFTLVYKDYFKKNKKINELCYRGLPLNRKESYFIQEEQLEETLNLILDLSDRKIKKKRIIQLPNPENITVQKFENFISKQKKFYGFELIPSWHKKNILDKKYLNFLSLVTEMNLPLSLEVDYIFRNSLDKTSNFFNIIKKFPKIRYWLPHLGCGVFLHWDKITKVCKHKPCLLTSTKNFKQWLRILNLKNYKNIPEKFATDHPFNDNASHEIYKNWFKLR